MFHIWYTLKTENYPRLAPSGLFGIRTFVQPENTSFNASSVVAHAMFFTKTVFLLSSAKTIIPAETHGSVSRKTAVNKNCTHCSDKNVCLLSIVNNRLYCPDSSNLCKVSETYILQAARESVVEQWSFQSAWEQQQKQQDPTFSSSWRLLRNRTQTSECVK